MQREPAILDKNACYDTMDKESDKRKLKARLNKYFDEKLNELDLEDLVAQYVTLAIMYHTEGTVDFDHNFSSALCFVCTNSYDIGNDCISKKIRMSSNEFDISVVTRILESVSDHNKGIDAYTMYLLRWAACRVYDFLLEDGLNWEMMAARIRDCAFMDEHILSSTDIDAQELNFPDSEEVHDEFLDTYGDMKEIMSHLQPLLKELGLEEFYENNRQNCILLALIGRLIGNLKKGKVNAGGIFSNDPKAWATVSELFDKFPFGDMFHPFVDENRKQAIIFWAIGIAIETESIIAGHSDLFNFEAMSRYQDGDEASVSMLIDMKKKM